MNAPEGNHVTNFTVPGMEKSPAAEVIGILESRMVATIDLQLTLKHIHWNVVGPTFISDHREAIAKLADLDPVSEDMLIGDLAQLEQFQWFVRAHLESSAGQLPTAAATTEAEAVKAVQS